MYCFDQPEDGDTFQTGRNVLFRPASSWQRFSRKHFLTCHNSNSSKSLSWPLYTISSKYCHINHATSGYQFRFQRTELLCFGQLWTSNTFLFRGRYNEMHSWCFSEKDRYTWCKVLAHRDVRMNTAHREMRFNLKTVVYSGLANVGPRTILILRQDGTHSHF